MELPIVIPKDDTNADALAGFFSVMAVSTVLAVICVYFSLHKKSKKEVAANAATIDDTESMRSNSVIMRKQSFAQARRESIGVRGSVREAVVGQEQQNMPEEREAAPLLLEEPAK